MAPTSVGLSGRSSKARSSPSGPAWCQTMGSLGRAKASPTLTRASMWVSETTKALMAEKILSACPATAGRARLRGGGSEPVDGPGAVLAGGGVFCRSPAGGEEAATPEPVIQVGHGLGEGGGVVDEVGIVEDVRRCDGVVGGEDAAGGGECLVECCVGVHGWLLSACPATAGLGLVVRFIITLT